MVPRESLLQAKNSSGFTSLLKNIGQGERDLPAPEHFSVLDGATEFKSTYGRRKDHADYMVLTTGMVQGQEWMPGCVLIFPPPWN